MTTEVNIERPTVTSGAARFSPGGEAYDIAAPIRATNLSLDVGWSSILVRALDIPKVADPIDFPINYDQMVAVCLDGECDVQSFARGSWTNGYYRPGVSGMTPAGKTDRLRFWPTTAPSTRFLQICIPRLYFTAAEDQLRGRGARFSADHPLNALCFSDPLIFQTAIALDQAIGEGAPNFYGEAVAQLLAVHLLARQRGKPHDTRDARRPEAISDRRLTRVLEYIDHHFAESLSLADLASQAGISPYHFIRAFKSACGTTPYRYLIAARMRAAASLLRESDLGTTDVASRCGYEDPQNFRVAFRKYFGQSPGAYRRSMAEPRQSPSAANRCSAHVSTRD